MLGSSYLPANISLQWWWHFMIWMVLVKTLVLIIPKSGDIQPGPATRIDLVEVNFCKSLQQLSNVFVLQVAKLVPLVRHRQLHCCLDHCNLGFHWRFKTNLILIEYCLWSIRQRVNLFIWSLPFSPPCCQWQWRRTHTLSSWPSIFTIIVYSDISEIREFPSFPPEQMKQLFVLIWRRTFEQCLDFHFSI